MGKDPRDVAREHEQIQREAEARAGRTPGGLTPSDLTALVREEHPQAGFGGLARTPRSMAGAGMSLAGLALTVAGLFGVGNAAQTPSSVAGASASPTTTATASARTTPPAATTPALSGSATGNASFTKVSGPCNFARQFTDRFSLTAKDGALTLRQLSNDHITKGTIDANGSFATSGEGQGYSGTVSGTSVQGRHTYTADGCNEVYDFTMQLSGPLLATGGASTGANRPPQVGPIVATFAVPVTTYRVQASDPDGDALTYSWTSTNPCGTTSGATTPSYAWSHPDPPCPNEAVHPGAITVVVSDGRSNVTRQYLQGSAAGTGTVPADGGIVAVSAPPSAIPTTTSRPTVTLTSAPTASPTTEDGGGGPNGPLTGGGLVLVGAGAAVLAGTREREKAKKSCDRERAEEERTRREMERTKDAFDDIDQTRRGRDFARDEAARAGRAWDQAKRGAAMGEDPVTHEPIFGSGARSQAARQAYEADRDAQDRAQWRQRDYDAKGGDAKWQQAKDAYDAAKAAHDAAADALARCEESLAPPPPPEPPPPPPTTTGGGVSIPTGGGESTQTRERRCPEGTKRNETSTDSEPVKFYDVGNAEILCEGTRIITDQSDARAFLEWLGIVQETFSKVKMGKSFAEGDIAGGTLDAIDFPDFFTYFGKIRERLDAGMGTLLDILRQYNRRGFYSVRVTEKTYVVVCRRWEECVDGSWVAKTATSLRLVSAAPRNTRDINVGREDDIANTEDARREILNRIFLQLANKNAMAERRVREAQSRCTA